MHCEKEPGWSKKREDRLRQVLEMLPELQPADGDEDPGSPKGSPRGEQGSAGLGMALVRCQRLNLEAKAEADLEVAGAIRDKLDNELSLVVNRMSRFHNDRNQRNVSAKFDDALDKVADLCEAFTIFDLDGGGTVGVDEVAKIIQALGQEVVMAEVEATVNASDSSGDGELDQAEFIDFMLTEPWASKLKLQGQMKEFRQLFTLLDTEKNGDIGATELAAGLHRMGRESTEQEVESLVSSIDNSGDGEIDLSEFVVMLTDPEPSILSVQIGRLRGVYQLFNVTGRKDGFDSSDLQQFLALIGQEMSQAEVTELMYEGDEDGDGIVDFGEFCEMVLSPGNPAAQRFREMVLNVLEPYSLVPGHSIDGTFTLESLTQMLCKYLSEELTEDDTIKLLEHVGAPAAKRMQLKSYALLLYANPYSDDDVLFSAKKLAKTISPTGALRARVARASFIVDKIQLQKNRDLARRLFHWRLMVHGLVRSYRWFDDDGGGGVSAEEITEVLTSLGDSDIRDDYAINAEQRLIDPSGGGLVRLPAFGAAMVRGLGASPWMNRHPLERDSQAFPAIQGFEPDEILVALETTPGTRNKRQATAIELLLRKGPWNGRIFQAAHASVSSPNGLVVPAVASEICQRVKCAWIEEGRTLFSQDSKLSLKNGTSDFCVVLQGSVLLYREARGSDDGSVTFADVTGVIKVFSELARSLINEPPALAKAQKVRRVHGQSEVDPCSLEFILLLESLADAADEWYGLCQASPQHDLCPVLQLPDVIPRLSKLTKLLEAGLVDASEMQEHLLKRFTGLRLKAIPLNDCEEELDLLITVRHGSDAIKNVLSDLTKLRMTHQQATERLCQGHHAPVLVGELRRGCTFGDLVLQQHEIKPRWPLTAVAGDDGCLLLTISSTTWSKACVHDTVNFLHRSPYFHSINPVLRDELALHVTCHRPSFNTVLAQQGSLASTFFVIQSGQVRLTLYVHDDPDFQIQTDKRQAPLQRFQVSLLGPGDVVHEHCKVKYQNQTQKVWSVEVAVVAADTVVYEIPIGKLDETFAEHKATDLGGKRTRDMLRKLKAQRVDLRTARQDLMQRGFQSTKHPREPIELATQTYNQSLPHHKRFDAATGEAILPPKPVATVPTRPLTAVARQQSPCIVFTPNPRRPAGGPLDPGYVKPETRYHVPYLAQGAGDSSEAILIPEVSTWGTLGYHRPPTASMESPRLLAHPSKSILGRNFDQIIGEGSIPVSPRLAAQPTAPEAPRPAVSEVMTIGSDDAGTPTVICSTLRLYALPICALHHLE